MNEQMKQAWLEISRMLGEPTREELDVFLRTWQRATEAHRKALAEQPAQQEPVEWLTGCPECGMDGGCDCDSGTWNPQAQQDIQRLSALVRAQQITIDKLEAQRTWVGLTDGEIDKTHETQVWDARRSYARAIEAKLKERNQ